MDSPLSRIVFTLSALATLAYPGLHKEEIQVTPPIQIQKDIVIDYNLGTLDEQTFTSTPTQTPTDTPTQTPTEVPYETPVYVQAVNHTSNFSGNGYDYGYCTYFVKTLRPDLPSNLGNAGSWYYNAQRQGWPTGQEPRVGAVLVQSGWGVGHVSLITGIEGDTLFVREANVRGWNIVSDGSYNRYQSNIIGYVY